MASQLRGAGIIGTGSYSPERILTNADLERIVDTSDEWILTRSGIRERRVIADDENTSDLAVKASLKALEIAGMGPDKLDLIICATVTGDMPLPATSCLVQDKLGITETPAFDLQAGCSGWMYSLATAAQFVKTGVYDNILVIGVDVLTRFTDWQDRSTCVLFGDGAGAVVIGPTAADTGILATVMGADGSGAELLKIDAGGSRLPASEQTVRDRQHFIKMEGREVFKFAVRIMEESTIKVLDLCGHGPEDIDLLIPHQANIRIIDAASNRLKLPPEKIFANVERYGNTSAASIPLALDEAYRGGKLKEGDILVVVGFGAGLTWASGAIKWTLPAFKG